MGSIRLLGFLSDFLLDKMSDSALFLCSLFRCRLSLGMWEWIWLSLLLKGRREGRLSGSFVPLSVALLVFCSLCSQLFWLTRLSGLLVALSVTLLEFRSLCFACHPRLPVVGIFGDGCGHLTKNEQGHYLSRSAATGRISNMLRQISFFHWSDKLIRESSLNFIDFYCILLVFITFYCFFLVWPNKLKQKYRKKQGEIEVLADYAQGPIKLSLEPYKLRLRAE